MAYRDNQPIPELIAQARDLLIKNAINPAAFPLPFSLQTAPTTAGVASDGSAVPLPAVPSTATASTVAAAPFAPPRVLSVLDQPLNAAASSGSALASTMDAVVGSQTDKKQQDGDKPSIIVQVQP